MTDVVGVGVEVGVVVGVGVTVDDGLKETLGLLLLTSVMVKELVMSFTVNVSVPVFFELTVKVAWPF